MKLFGVTTTIITFLLSLWFNGGSAETTTRTTKTSVLPETSKNLYAIPYETGVSVRVTSDHLTHSPSTRIDITGTSGGPYRIVAALAGRVEMIDDSHQVSGGCENNNYVWLSHANGEWTKYTHLDQYTASVGAGLKVGDLVQAGQYVGIESDIGCASGFDHLHWEVAIPDDLTDPVHPVGGYIKGVNLIPQVCGIPGNTYVAGSTYKVPTVRPGWPEYNRNAFPDASFQADFEAAASCGYQMMWNSGFDDGRGLYEYNVIYRPATPGVAWFSHRRLSGTALTAKMTEYGNQGYELVHIDVYSAGTEVRYAAIFNKGSSVPESKCYHGKSAQEHQALLDDWTTEGWYPRTLSVTSINGVRVHAALYTKQSMGSWEAKSFQTPSQMQENFDANLAANRRLVYKKMYLHRGERRFSAIWSSTQGSVLSSSGIGQGDLKSTRETRVASGWQTEDVTATVQNGRLCFSAYWVPAPSPHPPRSLLAPSPTGLFTSAATGFGCSVCCLSSVTGTATLFLSLYAVM